MNKPAVYIQTKEKLISRLSHEIKKGDVVVFMGAGDITKLCDEFVNVLKKI